MMHQLPSTALGAAFLLSTILILTSCTEFTLVKIDEQRLYERIGEEAAITTVIDSFIDKVAGDERVNGRFVDTDIENLKRLLVEQVCEATGGPCVYSGLNMLDTHRGLSITNEEFTIVATHFSSAMRSSGISTSDHDIIMDVLADMKGDIVGH